MEIYLVRHPRPCRSEGLCYGAGRLGPELSLDVPFGSVHRVDIDTVDFGGVDTDASQACPP
jgi:hypothetical protein